MTIFKKIFRLVRGHKSLLFSGVFFMLCYSIFHVAPAWYIKHIVDALGEDQTPELSRFFYVGMAVVLLFALKGISYFGQNYLMGRLGQTIVRELRDKLYRKVIGLPLSFFNKNSTGELISRFTIDVTALNEAIITGVIAPLRDFPQVFLLLGFLLYRSWELFLLSLILLPPAAWLISKFGKQSKKVTDARLNKFGNITGFLNETITGVRVVKAFGMEEHETARFEKENHSLFRSFINSIKISSYSYPILELIGSVCGAAILTYGGYLLLHGQMTGGDFASFILSFFMLNEPIKKMNNISIKLQEGHSAAIRIFEILNAKEKIRDLPGAEPLPPIKKGIEVKIKEFHYENEEEAVLKDIDVTLESGTITALVGASGSGKSTLSNLIPRFYDIPLESGHIKIDGVDLRETTLKSLRGQIAIVTQDVILFNDTIANNISYGDVTCSMDKIVETAKTAYAEEFINELPNKYEQIIGEKGVRLSGGQRQRIAISRALIKNAPILIMDEATSALDTESEKEVQAAIENLTKNRTSLVIAHRLSTIRNADVIHVMKKGRIVESGTHEELLSIDGEYKKLYEMQFKN